jgi:site-specific recombinase XerD
MKLPVEVLSTEDVERLLGQPDQEDHLGLRDAAVLATLYYAGANAVEIASLNVRDVEARRKQLSLRGEDGALRRVPLPASLAALLTTYRQKSRRLQLAQSGTTERETEAFFLANKPHRIRVQDVRQIVGANAKAAGLGKSVNLNTLRLSRAWHLREEGRSPESIQRFLGATSRSGRNVI